jgi:ribosomal protein S18 acetylase RimI-like enzyme
VKEKTLMPDPVTDMVIRAARPECRANLHALLERSWMTTWAPECPEEAVARFRNEDIVGQYLDACLGQMDVGLLAGRVVAMMHLDGEHLAALHVDPDLKGRGLGSVMMAAAEARGARCLEVRAFNLPAIRFYEGRGWERIRTYEGEEIGTPMLTHEYRRSDRSDDQSTSAGDARRRTG